MLELERAVSAHGQGRSASLDLFVAILEVTVRVCSPYVATVLGTHTKYT